MHKILILLSTYNGEKYIKQQLDSILQQEGVELGILVRDDGSKDSTVRILQGYEKKHANIFLYDEKNRGSRKLPWLRLSKDDPHTV